MQVRTGLEDLPSFVLRPDHEGVHGSLDVVLPLPLQLLPLRTEGARGRSEGWVGLLLPAVLGGKVEGGGRGGKERKTAREGGREGGEGERGEGGVVKEGEG